MVYIILKYNLFIILKLKQNMKLYLIILKVPLFYIYVFRYIIKNKLVI